LSININRDKLREAILNTSIAREFMHALIGVGVSRFDGTAPFTKSEYADKATVIVYLACKEVSTGGGYLQIRSKRATWVGDAETYYFGELAPARATSDVGLWKVVNGVDTQLGTEAVDITEEGRQNILLSTTGSTIELGRNPSDKWHRDPDAVVPAGDIKISVTDTSISSGVIGCASNFARYVPAGLFNTSWTYWSYAWVAWFSQIIRDPASEVPKPVAYFEMPVVGSGKLPKDELGDPRPVSIWDSEEIQAQVDPFRVELPQQVVERPVSIPRLLVRRVAVLKKKGWTTEEIKAFMPEAFPVERINRLAITYSAHIPSDKNGKPLHGTAIVRVYHSSSPELRSLEERIKAISQMPRCRKLSREEAIRLAMERDDKLFIHDLIACQKHPESPTSKCCREYIDWREKTLGVKRDLIDDNLMARYVKEEKW